MLCTKRDYQVKICLKYAICLNYRDAMSKKHNKNYKQDIEISQITKLQYYRVEHLKYMKYNEKSQ